MRLLKIYIVGLLALLLNSCVNPTYRYNIPRHVSCRSLSSEVFCMDSQTKDEFNISYEEALGYLMLSPEDQAKLYNFAIAILEENSKYARCRTRKCVISITNNHNK